MYLVLDDKAFLLATPERCRSSGAMLFVLVVVESFGVSILVPRRVSSATRDAGTFPGCTRKNRTAV